MAWCGHRLSLKKILLTKDCSPTWSDDRIPTLRIRATSSILTIAYGRVLWKSLGFFMLTHEFCCITGQVHWTQRKNAGGEAGKIFGGLPNWTNRHRVHGDGDKFTAAVRHLLGKLQRRPMRLRLQQGTGQGKKAAGFLFLGGIFRGKASMRGGGLTPREVFRENPREFYDFPVPAWGFFFFRNLISLAGARWIYFGSFFAREIDTSGVENSRTREKRGSGFKTDHRWSFCASRSIRVRAGIAILWFTVSWKFSFSVWCVWTIMGEGYFPRGLRIPWQNLRTTKFPNLIIIEIQNKNTYIHTYTGHRLVTDLPISTS